MEEVFVGRAGEYRVMSELLLRGFIPTKPVLDRGIDCFLDNGVSIQIKCAHLTKCKSFRYNFTFSQYPEGSRFVKAHFAICWAIEDNIFLIIPMDLIKSRQVIINPHLKNKSPKIDLYSQYRDRWDLLK